MISRLNGMVMLRPEISSRNALKNLRRFHQKCHIDRIERVARKERVMMTESLALGDGIPDKSEEAGAPVYIFDPEDLSQVRRRQLPRCRRFADPGGGVAVRRPILSSENPAHLAPFVHAERGDPAPPVPGTHEKIEYLLIVADVVCRCDELEVPGGGRAKAFQDRAKVRWRLFRIVMRYDPSRRATRRE